MKRIDYYAVQGPWKMPKWLGATLGGIFAVIAIGSAYLVFAMVRPPAAPAALAAAPSVTAPQPAAPVAVAAAPSAAADDEAPAATPAKASKSAKASKHAKAKKAHAKTAVAKRDKSLSDAKAHAILAKHDSKQNRKSKDDLDRLLGL